MTEQWRFRLSRLVLSCLLVSYIFTFILYRVEGTTEATPSEPEFSGSLVTPPLSCSLIVCAVDGSIYTIDALTGMAKGYFGTGRPLVGSSSPSVVPGLDGSIYTLSNDQVQVLPMTVHQVVQHPVQTCTGEECGVVTGTKHTFLYGLDPTTGRLEWTQQFGKTDDSCRNENPVVILHREDYVVRHISTSTGEELWNVTLGHVSALDFDSLWSGPNEDSPRLPGRTDKQHARMKKDASGTMPSIAFGSEGTTMTAVDDERQVLWKRQLNTVIAAVYGVVGNSFVPVNVLDTTKVRLDESNTGLVPLLPPPGDLWSQQRDLYLELLWREVKGMAHSKAGASGMVVFQPPARMDRTSAEFTRLAQKATHIPPVCKGITIDGICYETPLLESAEKQTPQAAGIYLTWDRLFVGVIFLGIGIRLLIAHNRRMWSLERQRSSPRPFIEDRIFAKRELSFSEHSAPFDAKREIDLGLSRVASLPDLATHNMTSPGDKIAKLSGIEKADLHRASTLPAAMDTSSSSAGQIDGVPFVKHSRYQTEFREIGPLGKGGFGTVFRCENVLDGRQYAIKKIRIASGKDLSRRLQRVLREVKTLARLDHPNIVRYYTAWLEAEEDDEEKETDATEGSNSMTRCYSVELLTSNVPPTSDGRRPPTSPPTNKKTSPVYDMTNPLGWNGIELDGSFDDKDSLPSQEGSDFGGFHFDRSSSWGDGRSDNESSHGYLSGDDSQQQSLARSPIESVATQMASNRRRLSIDLSSDSGAPPIPETASEEISSLPTKNVRHTLYIQMHLCSQKTLADFLSKKDARKGNADVGTIDIPLALNLFHQITNAVKHVHEQGLIHRDLKPSNCFIDEGVVKVGDFGLSRESSEPSASKEQIEDWLGGDEDDLSAGIGTRAYASPEQQKGSKYDSSTDVYSLGIILFELCYPMCTGMERNIVFSRLRQREFPHDWHDSVAASFPIVHDLLTAMLSPRPNDRPSAETIANRVESLLGEYTVLYLDRKGHEDGSTLIRVEAVAHEGILPQTIQLIKDAAPYVEIVQYGLRGQDSKAIMEFALSIANEDSLGYILSELRSAENVHVARQISDSVSMRL